MPTEPPSDARAYPVIPVATLRARCVECEPGERRVLAKRRNLIPDRGGRTFQDFSCGEGAVAAVDGSCGNFKQDEPWHVGEAVLPVLQARARKMLRALQGPAPAEATLLSRGSAPVEAELFAQALRVSVATAEEWDMDKCSQACAALVHEAARLHPQLTRFKEMHSFGKLPMKTLEAQEFKMMVYILPELAVERCEVDELPAGKEATVEHWRAFVHLLQTRVAEFQRGRGGGLGGGRETSISPTSGRCPSDAVLGGNLQTVNDEQLARALRGELSPEYISRPPAAAAGVGGQAGVGLDGGLTVVPKTRKCKSMEEWARGFLRIICEALAEEREDLADFLMWGRSIAAEYSFSNFSQFYEHLIPAVAAPPGKPDCSGVAPAGAGEGPVTAPVPALVGVTGPVPAMEIEIEELEAFEEVTADPEEMDVVEGMDVAVTPQAPAGETVSSEGWWASLRPDKFIPVWDVLGGPRRHD
ncbi:hypothetical protein CYMTET_5665 [Cymbomonas tetramitiformis]|uniref:Uncharacterized protein n=1 Tax=Cymbomonas tetramitiformis TaxID=36881 RepID=A0AAE0GZ52_9CHLO|nr:hypothetical protein CYMTET_5665 [Cymbomonas tetramitiformis]